MEVIICAATSIDVQRATRRYVAENRILHNHRCEHLSLYSLLFETLRTHHLLRRAAGKTSTTFRRIVWCVTSCSPTFRKNIDVYQIIKNHVQKIPLEEYLVSAEDLARFVKISSRSANRNTDWAIVALSGIEEDHKNDSQDSQSHGQNLKSRPSQHEKRRVNHQTATFP
jgi:hypothetical protein